MSKIGLIGLGVMGQNLARNIANKGFPISVYNRTTETMEQFIAEHGSDNLTGQADLTDFVASLEKPRRIILMVKAGAAVDAVTQELQPLLDLDDIVIDAGNSLFKDTVRREKEYPMHFVGMGVSGGEEGALNGPSIMPGGSKHAWAELQPILEAIAAKDFAGGPCVTHVGPDGAGHYVKMVHNGIEYAIMQLMAEVYDLLRKVRGMSADEIADIFEQMMDGPLNSYLIEIAIPVLRQKEDDESLVDLILDQAAQKGTGAWTGIDGLERGVPISAISEAVFARSSSSFKDLRCALEEKYGQKDYQSSLTTDLEKALYAGVILAYAQGLQLIAQASAEHQWQVDMAEVCRIWQGGCIIRSVLLTKLADVFKQGAVTNILESAEIQELMIDTIESLKDAVMAGVKNNVSVPAFSAVLNYYQAMTASESPANFIQGLRDFFGAHTYQRIDQEGTFHTNWTNS